MSLIQLNSNLTVKFTTCPHDRSYQRRFTQEFASLDQIANSHVEVGASTAPVSNAVEWVICQNILNKIKE